MGRKQAEFDGDPHVVYLAGVEYYVNWDELLVGSSFFLPTVATAVQVRSALTPYERYWRIKLTVRTRVEYGRYGARVWRLL